jgi:uncharacterized membrane protein YcfT
VADSDRSDAPAVDEAGVPLDDRRVQAVVVRVFWTAVVLGAIAVAGATLHGLMRGLTFSVLLQWGVLFFLAMPIVGAVVVWLHFRRRAGRSTVSGAASE